MLVIERCEPLSREPVDDAVTLCGTSKTYHSLNISELRLAFEACELSLRHFGFVPCVTPGPTGHVRPLDATELWDVEVFGQEDHIIFRGLPASGGVFEYYC